MSDMLDITIDVTPRLCCHRCRKPIRKVEMIHPALKMVTFAFCTYSCAASFKLDHRSMLDLHFCETHCVYHFSRKCPACVFVDSGIAKGVAHASDD